MKQHTVGVIMNGVTGRMGTNQHLMRSMVEIIKQGGVKVGPGETIMPDPILIGRDVNKLEKLSAQSGVKKISTDLDKVLAFPQPGNSRTLCSVYLKCKQIITSHADRP